ncbi:hypothetical protein PybrP1_003858 [[Pythium] brassicae (nom. inval.)]|nr:hypothetical protein PybrP1_003858 [[Pythium] brassicae (nom. inval.)]
MHPFTVRTMMKRSFAQITAPALARSARMQPAAQSRVLAGPLVNAFSTAAPLTSSGQDTPGAAFTTPSPVSKFKYAVRTEQPMWENPIPHQVYDLEQIAHIEKTHHEPEKLHEKAALVAVKALRTGFDIMSGYRGPGGAMTERDWLNRCLFLETVAGVPGMVAGMVRHLRSLRAMRRDYGWIHTLLEEAENERMHLLIFMNMKQPGWFFRLTVLGAQGVFFNAFFFTYLVSPRTCHRFVGYLEEEAVKTYTGLLQDIEDGHVDAWKNTQAPLIARDYYKLPDSAQVVDMIKCIRADEANHRDVNHAFAGLDQKNDVNPFLHGHH